MPVLDDTTATTTALLRRLDLDNEREVTKLPRSDVAFKVGDDTRITDVGVPRKGDKGRILRT